MAAMCGATTRSGGACRLPAGADGRCRRHGGASSAGLYAKALLPDEKPLYEQMAAGNLDEEIRLAKVKLYRYVRLSVSADAAPEEKRTGLPNYADLMLKQLDMIRKLELARLAMQRGELGDDDAVEIPDLVLKPDEDTPELPFL